jgi:hypothetical protein
MFKNIDWFDFVVGGIIIGFIVNVAANFAQPKIERWWGKYSESRRNKNEAIKRAFDERVENLVNNKHEEIITRLRINRLATFGIFILLLGITPMIVVIMLQTSSEIILFASVIVGILGFGRAIVVMNERNDLVQILNAVDKILGRKFR